MGVGRAVRGGCEGAAVVGRLVGCGKKHSTPTLVVASWKVAQPDMQLVMPGGAWQMAELGTWVQPTHGQPMGPEGAGVGTAEGVRILRGVRLREGRREGRRTRLREGRRVVALDLVGPTWEHGTRTCTATRHCLGGHGAGMRHILVAGGLVRVQVTPSEPFAGIEVDQPAGH